MSIQMIRTMQTNNGDLIHFRRSLCGWIATFEIGFDVEPRTIHFHKPDERTAWTAWLQGGIEPLAVGKTLREVFNKVCAQNAGKRNQRFFELLEQPDFSHLYGTGYPTK